ncbi:JmjC domain-containing protein [Streptomyces sp. NPDC101150]|uniref:JmjC domain-containing protein n=1 Tax=Streptomyces sp. NPDC101150 TaxID=3366114 RepID=UPI00380D6060
MRWYALGEITDDPTAFLEAPPEAPKIWKAKAVADLYSLVDLDNLISVGGLHSAALTVSNFSRRAPQSQYTMRRYGVEPAVAELCDTLAVEQFLNAGYSLHISNLQRYSKSVLLFTERLGFELGVPTKAEAFMTPPGAQAFAEHYDVNDNLICQIQGSKRWRLYAPSFVKPLPRHAWSWADASDALRERIINHPPDFEAVLHPGSVLWIPRGWIHAGTATDKASLHVTLRPEPVSAEWVSQRLIEFLADGSRDLRSTGYRSCNTPADAKATLESVIAKLRGNLESPVAESLSVDLWAAHGELFESPVTNPIGALSLAGESPMEDLWFRPEGATGHRRDGDALHIHLGTARKVLKGVEAALVEGLISNSDYVNMADARKRFESVMDWPPLVSGLRAVGLVVPSAHVLSRWLPA